MRVNQTIKIGTIQINAMSSSSVLQIGTSGAVKARSETITEEVTPTQAEQMLEDQIHSQIEPELKKEGLPIETAEEEPLSGGTQGGFQVEGRQRRRKNRT